MTAVEIRDIERDELRTAAAVLGRGMRDNPINERVFGSDPEHRLHAITRFFRPVLRGLLRRGTITAAFDEGRLVGVCGMAPPGACHPGSLERVTVLPALVLGNDPGTLRRAGTWTEAWARRDPHQPHWHLGPVAVDAVHQGHGIGSALLSDFCARVDSEQGTAYLETDKTENVRFYSRFGFGVVDEADVLGVPNWFMRR